MSITIRLVTIDDYDSIYALWCSTEQSKRALNPVDDSREGIDRYLKRNPNTCFLALSKEARIRTLRCSKPLCNSPGWFGGNPFFE